MRDYCIYKNSYFNPDMQVLRSNLNPIQPKNEDRKIPLGTTIEGLDVIKDFSKKQLEFAKSFTSKSFIDLDDKNPKLILIPKNFYSRVLIETLSTHNFKIETVESRTSFPKCILDLKSTINARLIVDPLTLGDKVMLFNDNMVEYLNNKFKT
jgi:hypothetical protein